MNFIGGDYRITGTGQHSTKDYIRQEQMTLVVDAELWKVNHDIRWKDMCAIVMQDLINTICTSPQRPAMKLAAIKYAVYIGFINGRFSNLIKNFYHITFSKWLIKGK